jgi:phytoene dehydrogenase-like protein
MTGTEALIAEAPNHQINYCAIDTSFIRANRGLAALELHRYGYREVELDPSMIYLHPQGESIAYWRDPARTAAEIKRFSRADAAAYLELSRILGAAFATGLPLMNAHPYRPGIRAVGRTMSASARHRRELLQLPALLTGSLFEAIDERFEHPIVRDALVTYCAVGGPTRPDGSTVLLLHIAMGHTLGHGRPIGGTQALPNALLGALTASGGQARVGAPVAEILIAAGRAAGVRLESGEELQARSVLATPDPRSTFTDLLPGGTLAPAAQARVEHIPAYADNVCQFVVHTALSGRVGFSRHQPRRADKLDLRQTGILIGGHDAALAGEADAVAGRIPKQMVIYATFPAATDPTQAPEGQDTVWMYACPMPLRPAQPDAAFLDAAATQLVAQTAEYVDGLIDLELGRWVESAQDLSKRMRVTNGCVYHVDLHAVPHGAPPPSMGLRRLPQPSTRLHHGGGGSHPSAGVSGIPGRLAAEEVIRDRRRAKRKPP